jgi:hypothetical protein
MQIVHVKEVDGNMLAIKLKRGSSLRRQKGRQQRWLFKVM